MKAATRIPVIIGALIALGVGRGMQAQDYPARPITVVVPFPAGGPSDVVARIVAEHMSRTLGQTLVIENVGGAGGTIGSGRVAAAAPDGYTLLAGSMGSHVAAPVLTPNIKYGAGDFAPIGPTAHSPAVIVARKDFPAKDLREFVAHVKQNAAATKQAHGGVGSSSHMACVLFNTTAAIKPTAVPYNGTGPAMNDLVGGHVDYFCEQSVSVTQQVSGGSIKAYGVSAAAAARVAARRPDREGGRHRLSDEHLGRHFRAQGHARSRSSTSSPARSTRRWTTRACVERLNKLGGSVPGKAGAPPGRVRGLRQGRGRALGADPESGGSGELARSASPATRMPARCTPARCACWRRS